MQKIYLTFLYLLLAHLSFAQTTISFESFDIPLDTFLNGNDGSTSYQEENAVFPTFFDGTFWLGGWAISTSRDDSTSEFSNLYLSLIHISEPTRPY